MRPSRPLSLATLLLLLGSPFSCVSTPEPVVLPTIEGDPTTFHFVGSALSGAQPPQGFAILDEDTYGVEVEWRVVAPNPLPGLEALGSLTRLHVDLVDPEGLRAAPERLRRARAGELIEEEGTLPEDVERRAGRSGTLRGLLAHGLTTRFRWSFRDENRALEILELYVSCGGAAFADPRFLLAIGLRDLGMDGVEDADDRGELILLEPTVKVDGPPFALFLPIPFRTLDEHGLFLRVEITTPPRLGHTGYPRHLQNLERCRLDLAATAEELRANPAPHGPEVPIGSLRLLLSAVHGKGDRDSLFSLARVTEARIVQDLALSAEDELITAILAKAQEGLVEDPTAEARALGWILDRAAISVLFQPDRPGAMEPAVRALLIHHLGAVALRKDAVRELLQRVMEPESLHAHLVAENRVLLRDSSSLVSARAVTWLRENGITVSEPGGDR